MIDCGRFRAPCASCDEVIPRGQARIAEPCNDGRVPNAKYRYHHFECGLAANPRLVQRIVIDEAFDEGLVPDPRGLLVELGDRIDAADSRLPPPPRRVHVLPEPRIEALFAELEASPHERGTLAVLADALVERGDPRGELIVLDLALDDGAGSEEQLERQGELRNQLLPKVSQPAKTRAQTTWGIGFIQRVELGDRGKFAFDGNYILELFTDLWRHPSLRLLTELAIGDGDWLTGDLPALRVLEITARKFPALPALPRLERLVLRDMTISRAVIEALASRDRKLPNLDVTGCSIDGNLRGQLRELCQTLVG